MTLELEQFSCKSNAIIFIAAPGKWCCCLLDRLVVVLRIDAVRGPELLGAESMKRIRKKRRMHHTRT